MDNTTFATFKYPEDILAHSYESWLSAKNICQITIVEAKKMLIWDDLERPIQIFDNNITVGEKETIVSLFLLIVLFITEEIF